MIVLRPANRLGGAITRHGVRRRTIATMSAWKINDSMDNSADVALRDKLKLMDAKVPTIALPSDMLVKVHSTSINPLDIRMCYGYGKKLLDLLDVATNFEPRITNDRYPLTLGRDFSGEIVACGPSVEGFKPGDEVMGAVEPQRSGAHAEYVIASSVCVTKKPKNLTHQMAATIPFAALTAYSALCTFGNLTRNDCQGRNVLILGGSGGVGSFAVQLLKIWGANVTATSSSEKLDWLENTLFVDHAISYNDVDQLNSLKNRFDFVLDCGDYDRTSKKHDEIVRDGTLYLKPLSLSVYVTLSPPILRNIDSQGVVQGSVATALDAVRDTIVGVRSLNSARWAVFLPNKEALDHVTSLYEEEALQPQVHSVFPFERMPDAYEELQSGRARGKVIVDMSKQC